MHRNTLAIAVAFLLLAPGAARAEEWRVGVAGSTEYDSNIFNSESGSEVDDFVFRVGPILELRRSQGTFVYDLKYEPRFETFVDGSAEDAWDHNAFARASWQLSPRTTITGTERFLFTRSLSRAGFISDPTAPNLVEPEPEVETARQRLKRNLLGLGIEHFFTARLSGTANVNWSLFRTDRQDRFDSDTVSGSAQTLYSLTEQDRVGLGGGITWQTFYETDTQPGAETFFYRAYGLWNHTFEPGFTLSVQVGPTFIDSDRTSSVPQMLTVQQFPFVSTGGGGVRTIDSSTCDTADDGQPVIPLEDAIGPSRNPPAGNCALFGTQVSGPAARFIRNSRAMVSQADSNQQFGSTVTVFANIELIKAWERWKLILRYQRTDSTASGTGQSTVLDVATGVLQWDPTDRWRALLSAAFTNRQSATGQVANAVGLMPGTAIVPVGGGLAQVIPVSQSVALRLVESDNFTDVQSYRVNLRVVRDIGRSSQVFTQFTYLRQELKNLDGNRNFDDYRMMIGFRWLIDWRRI